jgi:hypothetical protein
MTTEYVVSDSRTGWPWTRDDVALPILRRRSIPRQRFRWKLILALGLLENTFLPPEKEPTWDGRPRYCVRNRRVESSRSAVSSEDTYIIPVFEACILANGSHLPIGSIPRGPPQVTYLQL